MAWLLGLALAARGQNLATITTVAGGGPGDNGLATKSSVGTPTNLAADGNGNLFISDFVHNRVRKVDAGGTISTVAGNGSPGFFGDGGPAINAQINVPAGLAADAHGDLFFADLNNNRVRKVDANGVITTVAGNGTVGFSGDGGPATNAALGFTNPKDNPGPAPYLAVDPAGNLFIADIFNFRIRKVDTSGLITTVAGSTRGFSGDGGPAVQAQFSFLAGLAVDSKGNIFIADAGNDRVRQVDAKGIIKTIAGTGLASFGGDGGPAINAFLNGPVGLALDAAGNLFIVDESNGRIREVNTLGIINTVAGNGNEAFSGDGGAATSASLNRPEDVAVDSQGNLYIADSLNFRVRKVDLSGIITTAAGTGEPNFSGDGGPATSAVLDHPLGVAVDGAGNIFISDTENDRVRKVFGSGIINTVAGGTPEVQFPRGLSVDVAGNVFFGAADSQGNFSVQKLDISGGLTSLAGIFLNVGDVTVNSTDVLFVGESCIQKLAGGNGITVAGICSSQVRGFSGDGGPATSARLNFPAGVDLDSAGNFYIADSGNNRIRKVDTNGIINTVAGNGDATFAGDGGLATSASLNLPNGVRIVGNELFIADTGNHRIRRVNDHGVITTVAGDGREGFSGDGGPATSASLDAPFAVAVDTNNILFIADTNNSRIRKVPLPGFTITVKPASATIKAGQSVSFTLTAAPLNQFPVSLSFACSGLPASSSCTFNPASVTLNGSSATVTATMHTTGPSAALCTPQLPLGEGESSRAALTLWTLGVVTATVRRRNRRGRRWGLVALCVMLLLVAVMMGCGGGSAAAPPQPPPQPPPPTPAGVSNVSIIATSTDGSVINLADVNLTVTQ
jgi:sugar lactone lactonase YvrE